MADLLRESPFGQLTRLVTRNRFFLYPEEVEPFEGHQYFNRNSEEPHPEIDKIEEDGGSQPTESRKLDEDGEASAPHPESEKAKEDDIPPRPSSTLFGEDMARAPETPRDEEAAPLEQSQSRPIAPVISKDGTILVDWYRTDDPANPQNWSSKKKFFVALQINLYTLAVYSGSSIYVNSELGVMAKFGVGEPKASLGLGLYVLGYGIGPLLWSPMAEIPQLGRNLPYVISFAIFIVLAVPTALVDNLGGLLVLRFLQGFFGSPCLATGAASMQDLFSPLKLTYAVGLWAASAFLGPAIGPTLSGFSAAAEGWRWSLWEILWMSAPVFVLWFFFLPETLGDTILLQRARRLRKRYPHLRIQSSSEIKRRGLKPRTIVLDAIIKPFEIMILDPAVLFTNIYTALIYGTYYSFFESFPLVYGPFYGFNMGVEGVAFLVIVVGVAITMPMYFALIHFIVIPDIKKNGMKSQEEVLKPALIATFGPPIALFMFGWTANVHVNYIASIIAIGIYAGTCYVVVLAIFTYLPMSYPAYAASLFAGNDFSRSALAFGAILFSRPMYINLGIGKGCSLLGGLSILGIIGIWVLFFYGEKLRKRSKFAVN